MLKSKENTNVPSTVFKTRQNGEWLEVTTEEIFKDKTVIVFSLPGAFTPTCSTSHLPRYDELAKTFQKYGVDEIVVMSVNDTFAMNAWEKEQGTENIRFIPDGNGTFTKEMGMLVDKEDLGFGKRSWRYSMLVKNGLIVKQFIEPNKAGDPFEVSDADTMLQYIAPEHKEKDPVTIFTKNNCPFCVKAKKLLKDNGYEYEEILLNNEITSKTLKATTGRKTVPQIFISGVHIGGSDDLELFLK